MATDNDILGVLEHYGVKGQRWGVVKKEDSSRSSSNKTVDKPKSNSSDIKVPSGSKPVKELTKQDRRNANAQKFVDKADRIQKQIDILNTKTAPSGSLARANIERQKIVLNEQKQTALKDAEAKRQGNLSSTQKKVAIGVGVAAAGLAAYGAYHMVQSGNANRFASKGKAFMMGKEVPWKIDPNLARKDLSSDEIMSSVVRQINPGYGGIGTKVNCRRATMAYEMRRRGYDVAATRTTTGLGQDITGLYNTINPGVNNVAPGISGVSTRLYAESIRKSFDSDAETPFTNSIDNLGRGIGKNIIESVTAQGVSNDIFASLAKEPNGARGELGVTWRAGGGHSIAWEIIGGKPVIFDTQSGKKFESALAFRNEYDSSSIGSSSSFLSNANIASAAYTRLDNIPLNNDFLMRWLKDA